MAESIRIEPSADVRQGAKAMYQLFIALVQEGFTEAQALKMVSVMVQAQISGGGTGG